MEHETSLVFQIDIKLLTIPTPGFPTDLPTKPTVKKASQKAHLHGGSANLAPPPTALTVDHSIPH